LAILAITSASFAQEVSLDEYIVYGVNGTSHELVRYDFAESAYESLGTIHFADNTVLTGIEGMAYISKNLNLFGFWHDDVSSESRLIYINSHTAQATIVGQSLGSDQVTAATVAMMDVDANGNLLLGTDGDHDKGHGNDCDGDHARADWLHSDRAVWQLYSAGQCDS
jgi:hypothetical protein